MHHGAVGVARTLGRLGVPVYAVVEDRYTPVAMSRYVTKAFVWERWPKDRDEFINELSKIGGIIKHLTVLVPTDDLSAILIAENADVVGRWFIFPKLSPPLPRQLANKAKLFSLCKNIGIPCARSLTPRSADEVCEFIEPMAFPIMAKAAEQWLLLNDKYSTKMVQTRAVLLELYHKNECYDASRVVLQEFIPGEDWIYHGYCNSQSNLYLSFTGKKRRSYPRGAGSTALGLSADNAILRSQSERLLKAISYSGIIDIDWRRDVRDGQYKILDCNPRVGQNFRMFEDVGAIDVVRAQHLNLTGRSIECSKMVEGRRFIVESFVFLSILRNEVGGQENTEENLYDGTELAWWSSDDPRPFFTMSVRLFFGVVKRVLRRLWNYAIHVCKFERTRR